MQPRPSALALSALLMSGGCAQTTLVSPRALRSGEVQVGGHVGIGVALPDEPPADEDEAGSPPFGLLAVTGRFGLGHGIEAGLNLALHGVDGVLKYAPLDPDFPLQVAVFATGGFYYWLTPSASAGLVMGYDIAGVVMPYLGYRHHVGLGAGVYSLIGGLEFTVDGDSITAEVNVTPSDFAFLEDESEDTARSYTALTLTGGFSITF